MKYINHLNSNIYFGSGNWKRNWNFGMTEEEIITLLGKPTNVKEDGDESNRKFLEYNDLELRLSIFKDHGNVLGYIYSSNKNISFNNVLIKDMLVSDFIYDKCGLNHEWKLNEYHSFSVFSLDEFWMSLNVEFDKIKSIELGVMIDEQDEYVFDLGIVNEVILTEQSKYVKKKPSVVIEHS